MPYNLSARDEITKIEDSNRQLQKGEAALNLQSNSGDTLPQEQNSQAQISPRKLMNIDSTSKQSLDGVHINSGAVSPNMSKDNIMLLNHNESIQVLT